MFKLLYTNLTPFSKNFRIFLNLIYIFTKFFTFLVLFPFNFMISIDQQKGPVGKCRNQLAGDLQGIGSQSQAIDFSTKTKEKTMQSLKEDANEKATKSL